MRKFGRQRSKQHGERPLSSFFFSFGAIWWCSFRASFRFLLLGIHGHELKGASLGCSVQLGAWDWYVCIYKYKLAWEVFWQLFDSYPYSRSSVHEGRCEGVCWRCEEIPCQAAPPPNLQRPQPVLRRRTCSGIQHDSAIPGEYPDLTEPTIHVSPFHTIRDSRNNAL